MKQIIFKKYGSPEVLELIETEKPVPQAGEVLIKVEAIGVNYSDVLRRRNEYFMPTNLPFVLGTEAVGEMVETDENVDAEVFQANKNVLAILPGGGGYAEFVCADARYCIPIPDSISAEEATAIFVQGSTAFLLLHEIAEDFAKKTILIHAAAGGVGSLLVKLAKIGGAGKIIAASSSDGKLQTAISGGADAVVNYSEDDWTEKVIEANGGKKVDFIFEMVGGEIYAKSFECLEKGGTMIVYGAASGEKGLMDSGHFVDENHNLKGFNLAYFIQNKTDLWQNAMSSVIGLAAEGKLKIDIGEVFPLANAAEAHAAIEARKTTGKVVLKP